MENKNTIPLYKKIRLELIDLIKSSYGVGEKLPSENELGLRFNASRITIRAALKDLENEGYIKKHQGKGTFVDRIEPRYRNRRFTRSSDILLSWNEEMSSQGSDFHTKKISIREVSFPHSLKELFDLNWLNVRLVERIILVDNRPILIKNYLNPEFAKLLTDDELWDCQLYELFKEKLGMTVSHGVEVVEARTPTNEEIEDLTIQSNDALIQINRLSISQCGKNLIVGQLISLGSNYQYRSSVYKQ